MNSPPQLNMPESWQINAALLLVRIASALAFLYHGSAILFGAFGGPGPDKFAAARNMPVVIGYLVGLAQVAGGLAVLTGILTRVGAACVALVMLGAIFLVHLPHGFQCHCENFEVDGRLILTKAARFLAHVVLSPRAFAYNSMA
jgi:putative oxidoreductase